ncbi:unnamed protein product [Cyclocybe aegerita]|uniref:Tyr recombinase domain-containing protein n=1 Tax=Cyclocybe aegerita TaxID=1973307 RepID=A0A8S0WIJ6_CYCAE|nr:unnamed protein product [Cyclocybe aegerita]
MSAAIATATTPRTTLDAQGNPTNLTPANLARIMDILTGSWERSTLETYSSGLLIYHVYCDDKGIDEEQRALMSLVLAVSFVSMLAGAYSGSTIRNYFYGVCAWHILHGIPWEMNEPEMEALLKGAEKAAPASSKRKKRVPYTLDFITAIKGQLDLSKPFDSTVYACLTTTFYAAARLGEFVIPNLKSFNAALHVKPSDIKHETDHNGLHSTVFHIPRTKASIHGEDVSWSRQNSPTDPEVTLQYHLEINMPPPNSALFAYKYKNGHRPMTKPAFLKVLATAAKSVGLEPRQGHGIRIGSTLEYLLCGIPFEVVKVKGQWASDAFLIYLTKHAQILAPYMQAWPELHSKITRLTMPHLRHT